MTQEELNLIKNLAERLKVMSGVIDSQADEFIANQISSQSNAVYKLVQLVLLQDQYISKIQQQQQPKSFLGDLKDKLFGASKPQQTRPVATSGYAQVQPTQSPVYQQQVPNAPVITRTSGSGGFLAEAATIGAGVAGGMLLANAVENMFDGKASSQQQPQEIVTNNYYESDNSSNNDNDDYSDNSSSFDSVSSFDGGGFDSSNGSDW